MLTGLWDGDAGDRLPAEPTSTPLSPLSPASGLPTGLCDGLQATNTKYDHGLSGLFDEQS